MKIKHYFNLRRGIEFIMAQAISTRTNQILIPINSVDRLRVIMAGNWGAIARV